MWIGVTPYTAILLINKPVKPKMSLIAEHNLAINRIANRRLIFEVNLDNLVALFKRESIRDDLPVYAETNNRNF